MASVGSPTQHGEHSDIQSPDVPEESSSTTRRDDDSPKMMSPDDSAGPSVQKRRRVTRACDECRKKKIRCDGKHPCNHCTVYSYDCSYDQPSNRRRNPNPAFVEEVQKKLERAEALLHLCFPDLSLDDSRFDQVLDQALTKEDTNLASIQSKLKTLVAEGASSLAHVNEDQEMESMVTSEGALHEEKEGEYSYYGASSGMNFMRRVGEEFENIQSRREGSDAPAYPARHPKGSRTMSNEMMNVPEGLERRDMRPDPGVLIDDLPPKSVALRLVHYALDDACAILPCVHQPSFYQALHRIYDLPTDQYKNEDQRFLALLYITLALGCLFTRDADSHLEKDGYSTATSQGYEYFWAARQLVDVTDCRDLVSLQVIIFMIMFLQCSAKLATCYAFIGVAIRSALRMGMHRSINGIFNPIDSEIRKRCFWIIRKMDVFVGAMLGLPLTLNDDEIDQDFPSETDDEYITLDGLRQQPEDQVSIITASNHDLKLTDIVCNIVKNIYSIKDLKNDGKEELRTHRVRLSTIKGIERDLKAWEHDLHPVFKPQHAGNSRMMRVRCLLRMSYAHVQMMLYRPFLHAVSLRTPNRDVKSAPQNCAAACVHVSRNIITITATMNQNGLLVGSYWFIMYTCFFAVLSLAFYSVENDGAGSDITQDAKIGRQTLATLAKRSMAADRCTKTLTVLFDQLPAHPQSFHPPQAFSGTENQSVHSRSGSTGVSSKSGSRGRRSNNGAQTETAAQQARHPANNVGPRLAPRQDRAAEGASGDLYTPSGTSGSPLQYGAGYSVPQSPAYPFSPQDPHGHPQSQYLPPMQPGNIQSIEGQQMADSVFSSFDPFAYPTQPVLPFEQYSQIAEPEGSVLDASAPYLSTRNVQGDELVDVSMMGVHSYPMRNHSNPETEPRMALPTRPSDQTESDEQRHQQSSTDPGSQFPFVDFGDFLGSSGWTQ